MEAARQAIGGGAAALVDQPGHRGGFILGGPLLADDGAGWVGSALLVQLGDRAAVEAMLAGAPYVRAGLYGSVEIQTGSSADATKLSNCLRFCAYPRLPVSARRSLAGRCRQPR